MLEWTWSVWTSGGILVDGDKGLSDDLDAVGWYRDTRDGGEKGGDVNFGKRGYKGG